MQADHPLIEYPRALSIRAPWWWFILYGGKDIENREWSTPYRGPILIHASSWHRQAFVERELCVAKQIAAIAGDEAPEFDAGKPHVLGGAFVGTADLVDVVTSHKSPWFTGSYGFVLRNVRPIDDPIYAPGALGLFDPSRVIRQAAK